MADTVGKVSVRVVPDTSGFGAELRGELEALENQLRLTVPVDFDIQEGELAAKLAAMRVPALKVPVEIDRNSLRSALAAIKGDAKITLDVDVDRDRANKAISGIAADANRVLGEIAEKFTQGMAAAFGQIGAGAKEAFGQISEGAQEAGRLVETSFEGAGRAFNPVVGKVVEFGVAIAKASVQAQALAVGGATIGAVWGGVSTTMATIPALIAAVGLPLATVKLGMEGIERAAKTLEPQFTILKSAVSQVFQQGLTPQLERLKGLFPSIQEGFKGIAASLVNIAGDMTDVVTSAEGMKKIEEIFANVKEALEKMRPGLKEAAEGFLKLAAQKDALQPLIQGVNTLGKAFNEMVDRLSKTGVLEDAFRKLGALVSSLSAGFIALMENGIKAFAGIAPGLTKLTDAMTEFANKFDWERLGKAMGQVFDGLAEVLDSIEPQTIQSITEAFERMGQAFQDPGFQQGMKRIIELLPLFIDIATQLITLLPRLVDGFAQLFGIKDIEKWSEDMEKAWKALEKWFQDSGTTEKLDELGEKIRTFFTETLPNAIKEAPEKVGEKLDELWDTFNEWNDKLVAFYQGIADSIGNFFTQTLPEAIGEGAKAVKEKLDEWFKAFTEWNDRLEGFYQGIADSIGNFFVKTLPEAIAAGAKGIKEKLDEFFRAFTDWNDKLQGFYQQVSDSIGNFFTKTLPEKIVEAANTIKEKLDEFSRPFTEFFTDKLPGILRGAIETIGNFFTQTLPQKFVEAKQIIGQKMNEMVEPVREMGRNVETAAKEAWDGFTRNVEQGVQDAVNLVKELPGKIKEAFSQLASDLGQAGRDGMEGFIKGFTEKADDLLKKAKEIADQIVKVIKGALESSSPSRVFIGIGQDIIAGWIIGLESKADSLYGTISDIAQRAIDASRIGELGGNASWGSIGTRPGVDTDGDGITALAGAGGGIVNNITLPAGASVNDLVSSLMFELRHYNNRGIHAHA